jgi:hypothetical protein
MDTTNSTTCGLSRENIDSTAMNQFQKQMDLNDAVYRWKEKPTIEKNWDLFKKSFNKETKKNRNRQGTFKAIGLANAVTHQLGETNRENQQILIANSIEQNNVIKALVAKIAAMETAAATQCHTSRHNTRAGFDSAPQVSVEKGCSSIMRYGPPLKAVGAAHTTHPGLLLT